MDGGVEVFDPPLGYSASTGYDLATGWGTPDVANVVASLTSAPAGGNPDAGAPAQLHLSGQPHGHVATTMIPGA